MAKPIFVVGAHRSGTTWLGNLLCRHSKIAGVQSKEHRGIHESVFFSHVAEHYGDLHDENDFIEFVEAFSSSDYYRLTGLDKEFLYRKRPKSYGECFRLIMDRFAEKKGGAKYWVEKSPAHTLYLNHILTTFPNATVFGIKRDVIEVMESTLKLWSSSNRKKIRYKLLRKLKVLMRFIIYNKNLEVFAKNVRIINFLDLKQNKKETARQILEKLGLSFEPEVLIQQYSPNTSFKETNSKERKVILSKIEAKIFRSIEQFFSSLPGFLWTPLINFWKKQMTSSLPGWFWKLYKDKVFPHDLHIN